MLFLLFLVPVSAAVLKGLQAHGPSDPVVAEVGHTVLLPCTAQKSIVLEGLQVEWKKMDSDSVVNVFEKGKSKPELQSPSFKGRVDLFPDEMSKGNFSILLNNVVKEDAGVYKCKVETVQDSFETTVTIKTIDRLVVKGENQTTYDSVGEEVILNCSVDVPAQEIEEVTWKKKDGDLLVLLFQENDTFPDSSHESYRERAEFFITEIPKGNFSMKLKDVRVEDKGEFICEVHTRHASGSTTVVLQSVEHLMVEGANQTIFASPGGDVMLNCSVDSHQVHEIEEVTWKKKDGDLLVLLFQDNETFSDSSHESYQGRAEFFITEIPKGNFSLKLKDVRLEDKGEFICEIHTRKMSGRTIVVLQTLGFSPLHVLTLLLCIAAPLITVGPYFLTFLLKKKITKRMDLMIQATTNMCLGVAFILWLKEGFLSEVVICSVVCFARPIMLMSTSPYFSTGGSQEVKKSALLFYQFILVIATFAMIIGWTYLGWTLIGTLIFIFLWIVIFLLSCCSTLCLSLQQRGTGDLLCTVTVFILIISCGAVLLYYTATLLENRKDAAGYLLLAILVLVLAATALFKHPKRVPRWLHIVIYMFGTVGFTVINSVALASELILKAVKGARTTEDLRLIVLPIETLFVFGWLVLKLYYTWTNFGDRINRHRGQNNERNEVQQISLQRAFTKQHEPTNRLNTARKYTANSLL